MKKIVLDTRIFAAFFAALLLAAGVSQASAQGRYGSRYSYQDVGRTIATLEATSNVFRRDFDMFLDRSNINGTREEDRFNQIVARYDESLDRLRGEFDRTDSWWESRSNVQAVMNAAMQVDQMMRSLPFARQLERQWANMRRDLNVLANTYELPNLGGGGWNAGGRGGWTGGVPYNDRDPWGGSGSVSAPPSWAVGTFYSTDGSDIQTMIDRNGRVTVINQGLAYYGRFYRGQMFLNGDVSTVARNGNGIRTYNRNQGVTTEYSRTRGGRYDGGYDGGYNGPASRPPSWAIGTFYATNGTGISLAIDGNGRVTVNNQGQMYYGTYNNGSIMVNNDVSTVSRSGNGIRTYNRNTGETTEYSSGFTGGGATGGSIWSAPTWAVGRFYARNPAGSIMTLEIQNSGAVTLSVDGNFYNGNVSRGDILVLNNDSSRISRINGGIRTTRTDTGEVTDYFRRIR